jgi:hypothetical protein
VSQKKRFFSFLFMFAALISLASVSEAMLSNGAEMSQPQTAESGYLLNLSMPVVQAEGGQDPATIPGYYQQALSRQWTEVEGVLHALQDIGLVTNYTLLPEANAFEVTASPKAVAELEQLGTLLPLAAGSRQSLLQTAGNQFQDNMQAAIQEMLHAEGMKAINRHPDVEPRIAPPPAITYLVTLVIPEDSLSRYYFPNELVPYLEWLRQLEQVVEYEWLPQAYAYKVTARGDLASLAQQPQVMAIAPLAEEATQQAAQTLHETIALAGQPELDGDVQQAAALLTFTPTVPTIEARIASNQLYATSITNTQTIITLTTATGVQKNNPDYTSIWGWYGSPGSYYAWFNLYDVNWSWVSVEAGDILHVHQAGQSPFTMVIPELTAQVDREDDSVSGNAPANISSADPNSPPALYISAYGVNQDGGYWQTRSKYITTDAAGNYTTIFTYTSPVTGTLDLRVGSFGTLRYFNEDGNRVELAYRAPEVNVQLHRNYVSGYAEAYTDVTLTLRSADGTVKGKLETTTSSSGWYSGNMMDIYGNPAHSQAGDTVELESAAGTSVVVPVVNLTALADPVANTVAGQAPPNVTGGTSLDLPRLSVSVYWTQIVTTTAAGDYLADNVGDFNPGNTGTTRYYNQSGDQVYLPFAVPVIHVRGSHWGDAQAANYVSGYAANPGQLVEVALKRGATTVATAYVISSVSNGWWSVSFTDIYGNAAPVEDGDVVAVTMAGQTTNVTVVGLSADADPDTNVVSGIGPANIITTTSGLPHTLQVRVNWPSYTTVNVTTDNAGAFDQDFTAYGGIEPGSTGHLRYFNHDGHTIYQRFQAPNDPSAQPRVYLRGDYWSSYYVAENYVSGYVSNFCGSGTVTLKDSDGVVKAQQANVWACNSFGAYLNDVYGNAVPIMAGDTVEATFNGETTTVVVPDFDVTSDYETNTVTGSTNAVVITDTYGLTQTLAVWPTSSYDWGYGKHVLTVSGFFTATNPFYESANPDWGSATLNWGPGQVGHLRYVDADYNRVYARFQAPAAEPDKPLVFVRGSYWNSAYTADNYVSGYVSGPCSTGSIVLEDSSGAIKAEAQNVWACNSFGVSLSGIDGVAVNIAAGDVVKATFGGQTTSVTVPAFDITSDHENNEVVGVTNAVVITDTPGLEQTLAVWPTSLWDSGYGKHVLPANDEFTAENPFYWSANPDWGSSNLNWGPGATGHARYIDADSNRVYTRFAAFRDEPEIWVQKDSNYVWGYATQPNQTITVTLQSGAMTRATAYGTSNATTGQFFVNFYDDAGNRILIKENDNVVVYLPDPVTVSVPALTGQADANSDMVSGIGPANALVNVWVSGYRQTAATDAVGAYEADFRGIYDIKPGNVVEVQYKNAAGHTIYIVFYAGPKLHAQLHTNQVWGYAPQAQIPVTVTLRSGATVKGTALAQSGTSNYFNAYIRNNMGQRVLIAAGDTLEVAFGDGSSLTMAAATLTATVDANANTITGTGPANSQIAVEIGGWRRTVTTDSSGAWNLDAGADGKMIARGEQVLVRHANSDQNETWLRATAPVVYVRASGSGQTSYVANNYVSGYAPANTPVTVALLRGGLTIAQRQLTSGSSNGYYSTYLYDVMGLATHIQTGDQIVIGPAPNTTINVPVMEAEVDSQTNTVSGTGPASAALGIYVNGYNQTVHTAANGAFVAEFPSINPGNMAYIRYLTPAGHWIHARFMAEQTGTPIIHARWNGSNVCGNCVYGQAGAANTVVNLTLMRGGSTVTTAAVMSSSSGWFNAAFIDDSGQSVAIHNGDTIQMKVGNETTTMTVADLTAQANPDSGVLYGTGPANRSLFWLRSGWSSGTTTIGPDGRYNVSIGLSNQATGYVRYTDTNSHRTYLPWAAPHIAVRKGSNYVFGYVTPGVPVTVRVLTSGGQERAVATTTSSGSNGYFWVYLLDVAGKPLVIQSGNQVVVESSPATVVHIPTLEVTVNAATNQVTGVGPANVELITWIYADGVWLERRTMTDSAGNFTADFSDEINIMPGDAVWVDYYNEAGNRVYVTQPAPLVRVNPVSDIVDGYASPHASVSLVLKRGGSTIATTTATANSEGFFSAFFTNAQGAVVDLRAGDVVEVTSSPTIAVTVANLSASLNVATGVVTGSAPANAALLVRVRTWVGSSLISASQTAQTNSAGNFTADFGGQLPLNSSSYVHVRYLDSQGHQSTFTTIPAYSFYQLQAEQTVESYGATVKHSAFHVGNGGDLSTPTIYNGGGGKLVFLSRNGSLVLTRPDGSVDDSGQTTIVIDKAPVGEWQVQVRLSGSGEGNQYAIAIGEAGYTLYLPVIVKN